MDIKKILKNILDIIIKIIENTGDFIIFIFKLPFNLYLPYDNYLEDRKEYKGLPYGCWHCQLLGICRRPKEENWKCYNGCIKIHLKDYENKEK